MRRRPPNSVNWYQKTRMITLSCGVKISAVHVCSFILTESTRVTDGQTDGQTDRIMIPKTALA